MAEWQLPAAGRLDRGACLRLDEADPLAAVREQFLVPPGQIYLDGNSLGPLPRSVPAHLQQVLVREWGEGLIGSWNSAGWFEAPRRLGGKLAPLLGAGPDEVIVADSTSVNLFKLAVGVLRAAAPKRRRVLTQAGNFSTDRYVLHSACELLGGVCESLDDDQLEPARLPGQLADDVGLLCLSHVDFRSGRLWDAAVVTRIAAEQGVPVLWDVSHSVGVAPLRFHEWGVELAVGCCYKYLNGGPGAPAFAYLARRLATRLEQPLTGWMGHASPFSFAAGYEPADGATRLLCGTPPILALAALEAALDLWREIDLQAVRDKSLALGQLFARLVAQCPAAGRELTLASPLEPEQRGSQLAFHHPQAYSLVQALIAAGVIGDFREPDLLRFGFGPLFLRFIDIWDAVQRLEQILATRAWDHPRYGQRKAVT